MVERIVHDGKLLAIIVRRTFDKDGISFISPDNFPLQLGHIKYPRGHRITPHVHLPVRRHTVGTQEVLIIQKGEIRIDFYSRDKQYLESRKLSEGDIALLADEGHGMTVLKSVKMIEVKNGPFCAGQDKEKFEVKIK